MPANSIPKKDGNEADAFLAYLVEKVNRAKAKKPHKIALTLLTERSTMPNFSAGRGQLACEAQLQINLILTR